MSRASMTDDNCRPPSIKSIQMMRAIAAIAVMTMHICGFTSGVVPNELWKEIAAISKSFGHSGVDLFFVISGLIMYIITRKLDSNNKKSFIVFITHRILRIYPLFWVTLIFAMIALSGSLRSLFTSDGLMHLALYVYPELHPVSWTLPYEVRFYLVVAIILLVARKRLDIAFLIWGFCQVGANLLSILGVIGQSDFTNVLMTEFSMGLLVGALITRKVLFKPVAILIAAFLWFIVSCIVVYTHKYDIVTPYRHVLFGVPAALALYSIVMLESVGRITSPKLLCKIGNISYSIYLWHYPILMYNSAHWVSKDNSFIDGVKFAIMILAITFPVSIVSYFLIEKRCILLGRALTRSRSPFAGMAKQKALVN